MMNADPFVPDAMNGQAWNRYSYVINNPLALTDPNGYCFLGMCSWGKAISTFFGRTFGVLWWWKSRLSKDARVCLIPPSAAPILTWQLLAAIGQVAHGHQLCHLLSSRQRWFAELRTSSRFIRSKNRAFYSKR